MFVFFLKKWPLMDRGIKIKHLGLKAFMDRCP